MGCHGAQQALCLNWSAKSQMGFQLALLRPHECQGYTLKQLSVWELFWKIN